MKPTETDPEFTVCPKCGADTHKRVESGCAETVDTRRRLLRAGAAAPRPYRFETPNSTPIA